MIRFYTPFSLDVHYSSADYLPSLYMRFLLHALSSGYLPSVSITRHFQSYYSYLPFPLHGHSSPRTITRLYMRIQRSPVDDVGMR